MVDGPVLAAEVLEDGVVWPVPTQRLPLVVNYGSAANAGIEERYAFAVYIGAEDIGGASCEDAVACERSTTAVGSRGEEVMVNRHGTRFRCPRNGCRW